MGFHRTNLATGLLIELPEDGGSLNERLTSGIRTAIVEGRLAPGHLLPPSRALAAELGCSRWVVNEAYTQLAAEGQLQTRQGSGTRVTTHPAMRHPERTPTIRRASAPLPVVADLRPGAPDVAAFPSPAWIRSLQHVLTTADWEPSVFPPAAGARRLQEVLAAYLSRVRGLTVEADEILITCGTSHGVSLVARVLAARGVPHLAVEDPGWPRLHRVAAAVGLPTEPVAVDAEGLDVEALHQSGSQAVLCAPTHQFPTGTALSPTRRLALLAWAKQHTSVIIEDDYDAEFRYDRRPIGALAGLDRSRVVYLGSVSKTLHPGVRLGWMVPPPALRQPLLDALDTAAAGPSTLDQLTFARLADTGGYDRHLRRVRKAYRARRDALVTALGSHAVIRDCGPVHGIAAGLHLLVPLPPGLHDETVAEHLAGRGIATAALSGYAIRRHPPALVIGYGRLAPTRAQWAAEQIAEVLLELRP
ncbi:MocR-like pyridoxine biosynthesis transcription factor PdxR [Streptomyces europaeiscabiei]|uniref:MocR-like pyridoxine biosynthesis transcription factor PdxR n=1 Tax=Streptomyces europaeiscabiei TaxID=146819 RepID=UPI0023E22F9A|nr:PLP-dependent aminotransferase family protein [Streptomyces europaeiscabiei]MDX3837777.1 PLP-dependent aminotransferase family protein [Streptomyces europaeiscabiei]MDX3867514.1 PLP-dependent aminotransferase family protein [Streptomyces europaeiscabiei]MDX3875386.1 PLP-dependent aminotransferase family protein [Streptomyces europaeiscabiei]